MCALKNLKKYALAIPVLFFSCYASAQAGNIDLSVGPSEYGVSDSVLTISAGVISTYEITSVKASILGKEISLTGAPQYRATVSLLGQKENDTIPFTVTATDAFNNQKSLTRKIIYHRAPRVTVISPLNYSVARPSLPLKLNIIDADSCVVNVFYVWGYGSRDEHRVSLYSGKVKGNLDTTINFPATTIYINVYNGYNTIINPDDDYGTASFSTTKVIYVETNTYLKNYFDAPNYIMDFNYKKVFVPGDSIFSEPSIVDVLTNGQTVIPKKVDLFTQYMTVPFNGKYLTPTGAVFGGLTASILTNWHDGALYDLGEVDQYTNPQNYGQVYMKYGTNGDNLVWIGISRGNKSLNFLNLTTRKNTVLPYADYSIFNPTIGNNGMYAYTRYRNMEGTAINIFDGTVRTIASPGYYGHTKFAAPVTDGYNVVYRKYNDSIALYDTVFLFDGKTKTILSSFKNGTYAASYQVNNKWVAYNKIGSGSYPQVWLRDSAGNNHQVSYYSTPATLEFLSPAGDITFTTKGTYPFKRYLKQLNKPLVEITPQGKLYYSDGNLYLAIGRSLFKFDFGEVLPLKLLNFTAEKNGSKNLLQWSTAEEKNISHTEVERSEDGKNFTMFGKVNPKSSSLSNNYSFTDETPFAFNNYYRLKIIDFDGKFDYSPIREVKNTSGLQVKLQGNPVKERLMVKVASIKETNLNWSIISADGKVIRNSKLPVISGTYIKTIDVSYLQKGSYFLSIYTADGEKRSFKFVKVD